VDYVDEDVIGDRYPLAYESWQSGMDLAQLDAARYATRIGHDAREALIAFALELCGRTAVSTSGGTRAQIRRALASRVGLSPTLAELIDAQAALIDAHLGYWIAVSDLSNRSEHGAKREGERLTAEDGRRLLVHVMLLMHEVDRALESSSPAVTGEPLQLPM
jgi:hypothetical protein